MTRPVLLGLLLLLPGLARADFRSDFRAGVVAAERQDWAAVERSMRSALADRASPDGGTRILGMPYAPKFYLGLAAFSTQRCREAIDWLEDAATAAVIDSNARDAGRRRMMIERCSARLAREAAATAPASAAPATPPATQPAAQPAPRPATPPRGPTQGATPAAAAAATPAVTRPSAADEAEANARGLLRAQLGAYLAGRFETAAAWSQESALAGHPRLLAHALLARAAAGLELHVRGGERDAALLARVRADLARVRQLDPALVPPAPAYSPRLRALHRSAG